jgi:hypothetical protein
MTSIVGYPQASPFYNDACCIRYVFVIVTYKSMTSIIRHPNSSRVRDFSRFTDFVSLVEKKGCQVWGTGRLGIWISAAKPAICLPTEMRCKAPYTLSVKLSAFTVWRHTWRKNWVNCTVLTSNSAGLITVLSSRLSHRELRSSLIFLSLPADTTVTSSQGTSVSGNSFSR